MKWLLWAALGASLVLNTILIFSTLGIFDKNPQNTYPYLSKRIFVEDQNDVLVNFMVLRKTMRDYVEQQPDKISVYFEYLPSGTSIGVNDRNELAIASLIKTPLIMAVYKQIEAGLIKKETTVVMTEKHISKGFGDLWKRGIGSILTVEELIEIALKESDNTASSMLRSIVPEEEVEKVFESLDIDTETSKGTLVISPKSYSSIMRSLYLSSYLEQENSNEILDILTKTKFNDKIVAGVPPEIKVAHKIGIWDLDSDTKGIVYSDCGIFYPPNRPYLLCIMVKTDEFKAQEYMEKLSRMVYSYVTKVKKTKD